MPDEDIRFSGIESRLSRIEGIVEQIDKRLSNLESRFESRFTNLEGQIQRLDDKIDEKIQKLDDKLSGKIDSMYKWNIGLLLGLILPLYGLILFSIIAK